MATANLQPIIDAVAAEDTVVDSAIALFDQLSALIAAAPTLADAQAIGVGIKAKADALAAAVVANTPAAP